MKDHGGQAAALGTMGMGTRSPAGSVSTGGVVGPGTVEGCGRMSPAPWQGAGSRPAPARQLYPNVTVGMEADLREGGRDEEGGRVRGHDPIGECRGEDGPPVGGGRMQIGEVAARTGLSLRTIRHYEETGLVSPSARSQGGFRLYTETDVARLMVIRRMKPLGFTLDQMRELLAATDRLDSREGLPAAERAELLGRIRSFEQAAQQAVADLRTRLARAEEFAATLRERLPQDAAAP
ncbi:hypothetical protein SSP531S_39890 [Streptomyces spongiicola]|uniref:HTH merR-type domain-containing protein n=2 Tax=Streptomyces spongiicola TaxID=1690221 RepID=A0A388T3F3_9ACTN|nr:hypothetical protein SSP531S_39890 [Streptomyces spongiicola]